MGFIPTATFVVSTTAAVLATASGVLFRSGYTATRFVIDNTPASVKTAALDAVIDTSKLYWTIVKSTLSSPYFPLMVKYRRMIWVWIKLNFKYQITFMVLGLIVKIIFSMAYAKPYENLPQQLQPAGGFTKNDFPGINREEGLKTVRELADHIQEIPFIPVTECPVCKHALLLCACAGFRPLEKAALVQAQAQAKVRKYHYKINSLRSSDNTPMFVIGQRFIFEAPQKISFVNLWGTLKCYAVYEIVDVFEMNDTRSQDEKHIPLGNCRAYTIRLMGFRMLGRLWLNRYRAYCRLFDIPYRDLVVSEDLLRTRRRGDLDGKFESTIRAKFDYSLSIPICDPGVIAGGFNILRDSFFFSRALQYGEIRSGQPEDF
jgi:hypothetical protein